MLLSRQKSHTAVVDQKVPCAVPHLLNVGVLCDVTPPPLALGLSLQGVGGKGSAVVRRQSRSATSQMLSPLAGQGPRLRVAGGLPTGPIPLFRGVHSHRSAVRSGYHTNMPTGENAGTETRQRGLTMNILEKIAIFGLLAIASISVAVVVLPRLPMDNQIFSVPADTEPFLGQ